MRRSAVIAAAVFLGGCDNGTLTLSVADAPIDQATSVVIQFSGIEIVETDDTEHDFTFDPPVDAELLTLTGQPKVLLLDEVTLPAGDYKRITLRVNADASEETSYIDLVNTASDSGRRALELREEDEDLLSKSLAFRVERQENIALTAEIDLRRSIQRPENSGDPYRLVPSLRLLNDDEIGTVTGTVDATFLEDAGCPAIAPVAVYLYSGDEVTPDDVGGTGDEPVGSAVVRESTFSASFLEPDTYTAFVTCQPLDDEPDEDDDIDFIAESREFTLTAGETETVNFPE